MDLKKARKRYASQDILHTRLMYMWRNTVKNAHNLKDEHADLLLSWAHQAVALRCVTLPQILIIFDEELERKNTTELLVDRLRRAVEALPLRTSP